MCENLELLDFERQDGLCYVSLNTRLLNALEARNIEKFKEILRSNQRRNTIDINYVHEDPINKSLLEIACSYPHCARFVEVLINYGAEINSLNIIYKRSSLHFAIEYSDLDTVKLLVDASTNINIRDSFGNTPLHKAAELNKANVVELLLQHPAIKANAVNRKKQTPLHLAAAKGNQECALALIQDVRVDLDELRDFGGNTGREMVNKKWPSIELEPAKRVGEGDTTLFTLLHDRDVKTFKERLAINKSHVNEDDGKYTYLQYACLYGLADAVEVLLENGADPNLTGHQHATMPPIMIAARQGFLTIVQKLVEHGNVIYEPTEEGTVLHAVLDGMIQTYDILGMSFETRKHSSCLEYLLKSLSPEVLNINAQNIKGETVLHRAVRLHEEKIIRLLLDHGAYIGTRCVYGNMPISLIDPKAFKDYLDDCVVTNERRPIDEGYEIIFKYQFLVPPKVCQRGLPGKGTPFETETEVIHKRAVVSETEPLIEMSRIPELRHLLKHPVLTSFLNLKWFTIRKYFWINLSFYLTFWLSLTFYVLAVYSIEHNTDLKELKKSRNATLARILWGPSALLCLLLFLREFFQFSVSPRRYVNEVENWLEIALIVSSVTLLTCQLSSEFAAVAILLSWTELVLLIGRHPSLSTNIEMFKVVCSNFLKLLAWYSILILAFALSFYLLFKDARKSICTGNDNSGSGGEDDNAQFFEGPGTSIFKAVIMLTGEFDASSIPFTCHPGVSHVLFVLFVFLIAIVLFNLLNGLAVSDTQAIRSDAEIVGNVCRAQLITYIEKMATGDPLAFLNIFDRLTCWCCCVPQRKKSRANVRRIKLFYERINLFPFVLSDMCAHVLPNQGNLIDFSHSTVKCQQRRNSNAKSSCSAGCGQCVDWFIDQSIMKQAKEILAHRGSKEENLLESQLETYGERLNSLEKASKRNEIKLNELLELLKKKL